MEEVSEVVVEKESIKRISLASYCFWFGYAIYSLSYTISTSGSVNFIFCQLLQIIALLVLVPSAVLLMRWRFDSTYLKVIYVTYVVWSFFVISRGFRFDYQFLKGMLFDSGFGVFLYFAPLVLLFPRELVYYKNIFSIIVVLSLAFLVFDMIFLRDLLYQGRNIRSQSIIEYFSINLSIQSGFLLLTYMYHTKKRIMLALGVLVLTFLLAAIRARRGLMFMSISILTVSFFMYYYAHKVKIVVFLLSAFLILTTYILGAKIYNENKEGLFGYITDRLDEKTRSGVEISFFNDMSTKDWIIGKGIVGQYYCPGIDSGNLIAYRGVIETGYLQIILKGGIVSLALLLLIAIPAMFKGIFYSKNFLSKAAGIWILLFLVDLYPATPVNFSMNYLLVWLSIGICYSKKIRNYSESYVLDVFSGQKLQSL